MKIKKLLLLLSLIILSSCNSSKAIIADSEKFNINSLEGLSAIEILKAYPDADIYEDISLEKGVERPYFVLYRGTPNELHVVWKNNSKKEIHDLRFSNEGNWKVKEEEKVRVSSL